MEHTNHMKQCFPCKPCRSGNPSPEVVAERDRPPLTSSPALLRSGRGDGVHAHPQRRVPLRAGTVL